LRDVLGNDMLKKLFCKHKDQKHIRNIYGDEINISNGNRSWWKCLYCGKLITHIRLNTI